jgi:serine/threonine-protein kinase
MKCLEKDPAARPQSAREISRALEGTSTGDTQPTTGSAAHATSRTRNTKQLVIGAIAGVAIVSAIGAYVAKERPSGEMHSLAVLPFENSGGDTANAYFAEGMSDEITSELARVPGLVLASRNSVAKYRGADPKEVGKALDVKGVIDGTVRRAGDRLRLTAQLTDASSGRILWTETYEQKVQDVFAVQDSVTKAIVNQLKLKLGTSRQVVSGRTNAQGTTDLEAYDLYLRGKYLLARRGHHLLQALQLFENATKKDPSFARAYAGYAMAASVLPQYTDVPSDSITPLGLAAGRRAIELDPNLADAYLGIANMLQVDWKWEESEAHFRRALQIEPNNAAAHQWLGDLYWLMGRGSKTIPLLKKAIALDPASPVFRADLTSMLLNVGRLDEAREEQQKAAELDNTFPYNNANLAGIYYRKGQYDSVLSISSDPYPPIVTLSKALAYDKLGQRDKSKHLKDSVLKELRKPNADIDGSGRATYFVMVQNADSAFHYINYAIDRRGAFIYNLGLPCAYLLRPFHNDPRWELLLKRIRARRCDFTPQDD